MTTLVWIPDKEYEWILAEVVEEREELLLVRSTQGARSCALGFTRRRSIISDSKEDLDDLSNLPIANISKKNVYPFDSSHLEDLDDLCSVVKLSEGPILHILRRRFLRDRIYTYASDILISVNPYKTIPGLYENPLTFMKSTKSALFKPHVYVVANTALKRLSMNSLEVIGDTTDNIKNQSVIINGESGSGKTEASKYVINFLVHANQAEKGSQSDQIKDVILNSSIVLEAFANAKTVQNDNSSRFGKYIKLQYTKSNQLISATTECFLLEKSRLVSVGKGERNYHIFYQLLRGIDAIYPDISFELDLFAVEDYRMLTSGGSTVISDAEKDIHDFSNLCLALLGIGCTKDDLTSIWRVLAAILHLGNAEFGKPLDSKGRVGITIVSSNVEHVADLLGVHDNDLLKAFTTHTISTRGGTSVKTKVLSVAEAMNNVYGLIKRLYYCLFSYLLEVINSNNNIQIESDQHPVKYIGILDIFGFEILETNSFEQLCINFANERLQQQFNDSIFASDQKLYHQEGIDWIPISFQDNRHVIDLIVKKPTGLLIILEEHCLMNRATEDDMMLLHNYHQTHGERPDKLYIKPRFGNDPRFIIVHFAGSVTYTITGFITRNNDSLQRDLSDLIEESDSDFIRKVWISGSLATINTIASVHAAAAAANSGHVSNSAYNSQRNSGEVSRSASLAATVTVSSSLRVQLDALIVALGKTEPHYIKCIKPNLTKAGDTFQSSLVMAQLRYSDITGIIRIRRERFNIYYKFVDFYARYEILLRLVHPTRKKSDTCTELEAREYCRYLTTRYLVDKDSYKYGKTLIFLRETASSAMNTAMTSYASKYIIIIQKHVRGHLVYSAYQEHKRFEAEKKQKAKLDAELMEKQIKDKQREGEREREREAMNQKTMTQELDKESTNVQSDMSDSHGRRNSGSSVNKLFQPLDSDEEENIERRRPQDTRLEDDMFGNSTIAEDSQHPAATKKKIRFQVETIEGDNDIVGINPTALDDLVVQLGYDLKVKDILEQKKIVPNSHNNHDHYSSVSAESINPSPRSVSGASNIGSSPKASENMPTMPLHTILKKDRDLSPRYMSTNPTYLPNTPESKNDKEKDEKRQQKRLINTQSPNPTKTRNDINQKSIESPSDKRPDESETVFAKYIEESKILEEVEDDNSYLDSTDYSPEPMSRDTTPLRRDNFRRKSPHRLDEERRIRREVERRRHEDSLRRAEEKRLKFEQEINFSVKSSSANGLPSNGLSLNGLSLNGLSSHGPNDNDYRKIPIPGLVENPQRRDGKTIRRDNESLQNRLEAERMRRKQAERHRKNIEILSKQAMEKDENQKSGWNTFVEQAVNDITIGVNEITTGITSSLAPAADWTQPVNEWFSGFTSVWGSSTSTSDASSNSGGSNQRR